MSTTFVDPNDEIMLGISRVVKDIARTTPNTSYLTDSRRSVDKTKNKIQEIEGTMHPLALKFLNTEMTYEPVTTGSKVKVTKPIMNVLLELSERFFNYVDVMQYYINLMKLGDGTSYISANAADLDLKKFVNFATKICNLARRYKDPGTGVMMMNKEELLNELNMKDYEIKECIDKAGRQSTFLRNLLEQIKKHVHIYDSPNGSHDTLMIVCRHLREEVVPMLQVLTDMNKSQDGHEFIKQLDLKELISQIKEIDKLKQSLKEAEFKVRFDAQAREQMIGDFGTKFANKKVYSADEVAFLDSGNASQSVIGDSTFSSKGGRRTKRHKRSSCNKRNNKKRSNKRSNKSRRR